MKTINSYTVIILLWLFCSCSSGDVKSTVTGDSTQTHSIADTSSGQGYADTSDFETMYVVIVDTGLDYFPLQRAMYSLSEKVHIPVDTMNRYYDKEKDRIVLNENDEDDMYGDTTTHEE